ncbi:GTPase [Bombella saccharophila]|uniref:50S ribosome-binding GTPase n=1 Tax=Bombella saccharophila TaxID=2967338 RepID=A0ABT3W4Y6_9PROT|nr:GTPase [Bombella saccharophila]MCX5614097.1 50S ribosome-binding GTPase [Bombella saccharophila]
MSDKASFEFGEILSATQKVQSDLRAATARSEDLKVRALEREVDEVRITGGSFERVPPLTIAFVGQYNAGKSTILRVLTGREDIVIDANVCTDSVTAYDWEGVRLLDTPGVHAGRPDHDEKTYAIIDRADLIVFVVTNELFDDTIGRHFRELAFGRQHARRMLLVVNKMGQDPGSPETKQGDIEKVTAPLVLEDFRGVFVDAQSWIEAQTADEEDRIDLLKLANIGTLMDALNGFIAERGLTGRLSAPLFTMRGIAEQASALLSTDFPQERAALELLHRKRSIFLASRGRLRATMNGVIARAVVDIGSYGDEVAESIEPGKTEKDVEALHTRAQANANARSEALSEEARLCIETEFSELRHQLEALRDGVLARELTGQVEGEAPRDAYLGDFASLAWNSPSKVEVLADWPVKAKKIGSVAKDIGNWTARWATGSTAEGVSAFSATAARGSDAHKVVYNVGRFFGVKFRPWGAVNVARAIGNAGRCVSAIGGVLSVFAQIAEDRQQEQHYLQLRNARDGVRSAYRDSALSVQALFWEQFELFSKEFYDSELLAIDKTVEDLVGKRNERKSGAVDFQNLKRRIEELIKLINVRQLPTP